MISLTTQEIARITDRTRYRAQAKVLDGMGVPYSTRPDGSLVVSRLAYERALGGVSEKEARRLVDEEPDFEALLNSPPQRRYKPPKGKRTQPDKEIAPEVIAEIKEARRALVAYHANKRRAARVQQTPKWADDSAMRFLYLEASRLSRETGVQHHVDHVIPLQGDNVSGLHTPENMRVIPAAENIRKSNKFDGVDE